MIWYKRFVENALVGMKALTLEERGAYNTVLDLIYLHGGTLNDDNKFITGWLGVDVRIWKRIKVRLLALGKLRLDGGKLRNDRADVEVPKATGRPIATPLATGTSEGGFREKSSTSPGLIIEPRIDNLPVSTSGTTPSAPAPGGARSPNVFDRAKWADRLGGYQPWAGKRVWSPMWGPRPDASGNPNPSIPPAMLKAWRDEERAPDGKAVVQEASAALQSGVAHQ